jgi:hypothetical protein
MTMQDVYTIIDSQGDVKKVYESMQEAKAAVFPPYSISALSIDTKAVLYGLSLKLSELEKYSISCYNESGIKCYLLEDQFNDN